jgi:hypothetical protein
LTNCNPTSKSYDYKKPREKMEDAKMPELTQQQKNKVVQIGDELINVLQKYSKNLDEVPLVRIALYNVYFKCEKEIEEIQKGIVKKMMEMMMRGQE